MKYFDAFCGLGGFSIAIKQILPHANCVMAIDNDKHAAETFKKNFGIDAYGDMTTIPYSDVPDFDILFAGFPCQPFSRNGKWYNKNNKTIGMTEDRDNLYITLAKLVAAKRPTFFIFENVQGILKMKNKDGTSVVETIQRNFSEFGYHVSTKLLDAADYGSPQQRKRVLFVGTPINYQWDWPEQIPRDSAIKDILETKVDDKYLVQNIFSGSKLKRIGEPKFEYMKKIYRGQPTEITNKITPSLIIYNDTPSGGPRQQDKLYSIYGISPTLETWELSIPCVSISDDPKTWRRLTPRECARLQGIPETFILPKKDVIAYRQIGNAINVSTVNYLLNNLIKGGNYAY